MKQESSETVLNIVITTALLALGVAFIIGSYQGWLTQ
jgi:hypothetical protein